MLRPRQEIEAHLSFRHDREELRRQQSDGEPLALPQGWDYYEQLRNRQEVQRLRAELAEVGEGLDWSFDGEGVYGHGITFARLRRVSDRLGRTLRWTGRDLYALEGYPPQSTNPGVLAEPVVAGTFNGSFGLRVVGAPAAEQFQLDGTSLFDRTAQRVVDIFASAASTESDVGILEHVVGLRRRALKGLTDLATEVTESKRSSYIRWHGDVVVTISPNTAERLVRTLAEVTAREGTRNVVGTLLGGDLSEGGERFHIVPRSREEDQPLHYRGGIDPTAVVALRRISLGSTVEAQITVIYTESPLLPEPRESYILKEIRSQEGI